jgi:DNA primase
MQDKSWVDFKSIKAAVSIEMLLARYNVNWLRRKDDELRGRCPIHQGEGTDTFHASVSKNVFNCFSCKKRGNVLDFVAAMERCSVRDAAVKIAEWFSVDGTEPKKVSERIEKSVASVLGTATTNLINKPLSFQLKGIDHEHAYLKERGLTPETIETFGVGFFSGKGSMSGRVVIPIHDEVGQLVAYAGRSVDGTEPKYKLPPGFHKSQVLYNLHRAILRPRNAVVVVEGFFDCMHVWGSGLAVVALMGSNMSDAQQIGIMSHFERAVLLFDGDQPGRTCTDACLLKLAHKMWTKAVQLPVGQQPEDLKEEQLKGLLW